MSQYTPPVYVCGDCGLVDAALAPPTRCLSCGGAWYIRTPDDG